MSATAQDVLDEIDKYLHQFDQVMHGDEITIMDRLTRVIEHYVNQPGRWHRRYPPSRRGRPMFSAVEEIKEE